MKNILAENMLRFGAKNLSESDITKIEETILSERYIQKGTTEPVWHYFKDQAAVDALHKIAIQNLPNPNGEYNIIFPSGAKEAIQRMGTDKPWDFAWVYWHAQAISPKSPAPELEGLGELNYQINSAAEEGGTHSVAARLLGYSTSSYGKRIGSDVKKIIDAIRNPENQKWWNMNVEFPVGSKKMMTRWNLFSQTYLAPSLPKIKSLYGAGSATPATPAVQPGNAKAPAKPQ